MIMQKTLELKRSELGQHSVERAKPGTTGKGKFYHIEVRPKDAFVTFRVQDVAGEKGHIGRVAGKRLNGSWDTQKWMISKCDAHIENGRLVADSIHAHKILQGHLVSCAEH